MQDIRYVCLSDLHFGQDDGLLTNLAADKSGIDVSKPSPVLGSLIMGLRDLIGKNEATDFKPTLILNGDVMEIALTTMNEAAMAFERFTELALPKEREARLFDRIIYIPGNHDHHVWEMAREALYVQYVEEKKPGDMLEEPWHTSRMFVDRAKKPLVGYFLSRLIHRYEHLKEFNVEIAYPNLGLYNEQKSRAVVFHHGHFVEALYKLMSIVASMMFPDRKPPTQVWDIEAENFAWIDFFWSTMGRSGKVGPLVQQVYNSLGYEAARDKLLDNLAGSIAKRIDIPGVPFDKIEAFAIKGLMKHLVDKAADRERNRTENRPLSEDGITGLEEYLNGSVRDQLIGELNQVEPDQVSFVFGHTHKPYQEAMSLDGFEKKVPVYNTGGWVVETTEPSPLHGASAVLLDEELNSAALRLFNEGDYRVEVREVATTGEVNPFYQRMSRLVEGSDAWSRFSQTVKKQVQVHEDYLASRLNK